MRKFLSLLVALATVTMAWAAQGGTLTSSKTPIDPTQTVTLTYDGTGTNFANWEPSCFIHAWLVAADGQTLSKSYSTDWASCNGDGDYASLPSKLKMTYSGTKGKYTISMNIKEFFNVADADLPKIGKLGVIVRAQYDGDNNKTNDMFVNVAYTAPAAGTSVTYTVESTSKVNVTGTAPEGSSATYASTYNTKCQLTNGNSMTLTLSGFEGKKITGITLSMRSNKSGGKGSFTAVAGTTTIASIADAAFNTASWNGAWSTEYVDITPKLTKDNYSIKKDENVVITIAASANSLYCQSFTIEYDEADPAPTPVDSMTIYFVNTLDWAKVNAFVWPATGDAYKEWPGEAAVKTGEKALEKDIYSYTFPATFVNAIFNNGTAQTTDLKWDKAKPYFVPGDADGEGKFTGTWYASTSEIPVPCGDGPYSLLVNGTDTIKSVKGDEFDGYTQYVVYASLTKNDKIQVLNESCGALWMPAIEEGGASAHFKKGENDATIDSTGCFDLYIKMKAGEDKVYIGYGICEGDSVAPCLDGPYGFIVNGTDTLKAVALEEADAQGRKQYLIDSVALKANDKFVVANLSCDSKWVMDVEEYGAYANFTKGEDAYTVKVDGMYAFYIKMSLEAGDVMYIGEIKDEPQPQPCQDGPYGFIVNGTDTLKAVALEEADAQGRKQYLIDSVALKANDKFVVANLSCDSKWVMDVEEYGAYANFTKGEDAYTVKVDGMYAFYIKMSLEAGDVMYIGEIKDEPAGGCDWDNLPWLGSTDAAYAEQFKVCVGDPKPTEVVNIQKPGFATEIGIYITFPSAAFTSFSLPESAYDIQGAGVIFHLSAFTARETEVTVVCESKDYIFTVFNKKGGEPEKVYTIVGEAALVGVEWNPEATQNDMAKQADGSYKLVKENVALEAKGYEYKVIEGHAWGGWELPTGGANQTITITAAGTYNVTFTLSADLATLTAEATPVGPAPEKVYTIVGVAALVGVEWNPEATQNDMAKQADGSYKLVKENVALASGAYEYKVVEGHVWTGWQIPAEGNQSLTIDAAGVYNVTFTLDAALTTLTVTATNVGPMPEQEYGLMIDGTTFIKAQPNPATANEYMVLDVALTAGQTLQIYDKTHEVGWAIDKWNEGSYKFEIKDNKYIVSETAKYDFYVNLEYGNDYIYVAKKEGPSAIENLVAPANEMRKVMIDGKLYIMRDGKVYSVQGQLIR